MFSVKIVPFHFYKLNIAETENSKNNSFKFTFCLCKMNFKITKTRNTNITQKIKNF